MPDLDNMAKRVHRSWKFCLHAALADASSPGSPVKLGQALAYVLSCCAASYGGVRQLPSFLAQLVRLAGLPPADREQALGEMRFLPTPEGKECASRAAWQVGILICSGKVQAAEVARALSRHFLWAITEAQFFGCFTEADWLNIFGSPEAVKAHMMQARREVDEYVDGTTSEFAESLFQRVQPVPKPDLPKKDTAAQMEDSLDINLDLLRGGEDGREL